VRRRDDAAPAPDRVAGNENRGDPPRLRRPGFAVMNKWVLASILVALAAFMYISIIIRFSE